MSKSVQELWELLHQAQQLPYGAAQVALVEQLLRHADTAGDRELAFVSRLFATTAYRYGGDVAKSFVTFSWCLSDFDRDPAPFHARHADTLLWYFKWMVNGLTKFPEVPLERTYAVLDDMERRYREGGHSLQAVHKYRFVVARHIGDEEAADRWYERWLTAPRDALSDCAGCDPSSQVQFLAARGRDDEAIALAEPILAGRLTCTEQPQRILSGLLVPYLRTGRLDAAADAHRRAYRLHRARLADLADIGEHIEFCARTGNEPRGLEILQRHLDWLDDAPSPAAAMDFAASAALLLRRLADTGHGDVTVHRREHGDRPAADVPAAVLAGQLAGYATGLADRFDARNGSTEQSSRITAVLTAEPYDVQLPLSASTRRAPSPASAAPQPAAPAAVMQPAPPPVDVPAGADALELLSLAEQYERADRLDAVAVLLAAFDERFDGVDLGLEAAGRRAELRAAQAWEDYDRDAAMAALAEAAQLYDRAGARGRSLAAEGGRGLLLCLDGAMEQGRALVEAELAYQDQHGDARQRANAYGRHAMVQHFEQRYAESLAAVERAIALAAEVPDERLVTRYRVRRAQLLAELGRSEEAAATAEQAREFYRRHGNAEQFASSSIVFARLTADQTAAAAACDEALSAGNERTCLDARLTRARVLTAAGRPGDAVDDYVEAVALCTERGIEDGGAMLRHELAVAYRDAGRLFEAAEVAEEAVNAWDRLGAQEPGDDSRFVLAGVYGQLGDTEPALALYDELAQRLATGANHAGRGQVLEQAADVLYRADRDAQAAERFAAAADAYRAGGHWPDELRALRRRLGALHWADDVAAAEETIRFAGERHDALPPEIAGQPELVWERAVLGLEAGRVLLARDRPAEALPHVDGAPARLRAIGATDDADRVEAMLGEVLLRCGRAGEAATLLAGTLAGLRSESPVREITATVLAEALDGLGRTDEAAKLRADHGLPTSEPE